MRPWGKAVRGGSKCTSRYPHFRPHLQALEYQVQQGIVGAAKEDMLLMPQTPKHSYGPELHTPVAVLKLLKD